MQVLAVEAGKVTKEASFADDLDADSLDLAELVMALEDEFDITVEEEELEDIKTVGQAFDMVTAKLGTARSAWQAARVAVTGVGVLVVVRHGRRRLLGRASTRPARGRAPRARLRPGVVLRQPEGGPPGRPRHAARARPPPPRRSSRPATSTATRCAAAC